MKKTLALLSAVLFCLNASAGFGIIGGIGTDDSSSKKTGIVPFHAGLTYNILFPMGIGLQPSLIYTEKMAAVVGRDIDLKLSYVEVPVQFQMGINLFMRNFRLYIYGEPFIGANVTSRTYQGLVADTGAETRIVSSSADSGQIKNRFEYGIGAGGGIQLLKHFQLSCGYQWNLNYHEFSSYTTSKPRGMMLSAAILF